MIHNSTGPLFRLSRRYATLAESTSTVGARRLGDESRVRNTALVQRSDYCEHGDDGRVRSRPLSDEESLSRADHTTRIAGGKYAFRDVPRHDAAGADHRLRANPYACENDRPAADPHV